VPHGILRATVVVGNPKPRSRTRAAGVSLAEAVLQHAGVPEPSLGVGVIELAELTGGMFTWGDPGVGRAKEAVLTSDVLIICSPVFKASYTGLLKAFLDQFGRDELAALATVPLMVGGSPAHSLAVEEQLRPVLVEIGASCPTRGVFVLETDVQQVGPQLAAWVSMWGAALVAVMQARAGYPVEAPH
jgi:FMN reductase